MMYIMITHFDDHWDNLGNKKTSYDKSYMREPMNENKIKDNTKTIFIKRSEEEKKVERAWIGKVLGFKKVNGKFHFNIFIENEIDCPAKYSKLAEGWYVDEEEEQDKEPFEELLFDPKFFSDLKLTNDWTKFEEYTHWLIRCLGLHVTHKFDPKEQKGKADGFFKFSRFAVLYDCTLDQDFEKKKTQIENFCEQLKTGSIEYHNKRIDIRNCNKTVWIITRNGNQQVIRKIDDINVKEVPIEKIIELYRRRIKIEIDEAELETELQNL